MLHDRDGLHVRRLPLALPRRLPHLPLLRRLTPGLTLPSKATKVKTTGSMHLCDLEGEVSAGCKSRSRLFTECWVSGATRRRCYAPMSSPTICRCHQVGDIKHHGTSSWIDLIRDTQTCKISKIYLHLKLQRNRISLT